MEGEVRPETLGLIVKAGDILRDKASILLIQDAAHFTAAVFLKMLR